jgi:hypothetical protein
MRKTGLSGHKTMLICHYSPVISNKLMRHFALLASLFLTTSVLTGCAAGGSAETRNIKQVTDGVEKDLSDLKIRNIKIVALPDGSGTLVGFIVNHGDEPDQLIGLTINNQPAELTSEVVLNKNKPMIFEGESANSKAKVATLGEKPGYRVPVVLVFAKSGKVEMSAIIVKNEGIYSSIL